MSKRHSRSDGLSPEESHKTEKKTVKKKEGKVYETRPCRPFMAHETLPLAPQASSQGSDAHHDSLLLVGNEARVLHARIVVGILVEVNVHIVVVLSQGISIFTFRFSSKWIRRRSFFQMSTVLFVCWRRFGLFFSAM